MSSQYKNESDRKVFYNSSAWLKTREAVLKRDNYECSWCKKKGAVTTKDSATLEIDHIKELKDYPDLALDLDNLRVLCNHHHNVRHGRFKKKFNKWAHDEVFEWK